MKIHRKMKIPFLISLFFFMNTSAPLSARTINNEYSLTEQQACAYIDQCIGSLEYALRTAMHHYHLNQLKQNIKDELHLNHTIYQWTWYGKRYCKEIIDELISSTVLQFIEDTSYTIAYDFTYNQDIAKRISSSMRNNVLARIAKYGYLDFEKITDFVGYALHKAIERTIQNNYNNYYHTLTQSYSHTYESTQPKPSAPTLYESNACCICFESFQEFDIYRVFLTPCGHDMCTECARQWFFTNNANKNNTCPQCRSWVDLDQLSIDCVLAQD